MAIPEFDVNKAFLNSPKQDTDKKENIQSYEKVQAQNINKSQNTSAYLWASAGVSLNETSQNDTATAVANYVFENILGDKSKEEDHKTTSDLYIIDRLDYQNNTKHLGNTTHKGLFIFQPSFSNLSKSVNMQYNLQAVKQVQKLNKNNILINLEPNDIVAGRLCCIAFNSNLNTFILYDLFSTSSLQNISGRYDVQYRQDLTSKNITDPSVGMSILNTTTGTLLNGFVDENKTSIVRDRIYTIYYIENNGTIHYRENILKGGDNIFVSSEKNYYFYNGDYIVPNEYDGFEILDKREFDFKLTGQRSIKYKMQGSLIKNSDFPNAYETLLECYNRANATSEKTESYTFKENAINKTYNFNYKEDEETGRRFYNQENYNSRFNVLGHSGGFIFNELDKEFTLPKQTIFDRPSLDNLLQWKNDAIVSIPGEFQGGRNNTSSGAFYIRGSVGIGWGTGSTSINGNVLDISRVVNVSNQVQPRSSNVFIYYKVM